MSAATAGGAKSSPTAEEMWTASLGNDPESCKVLGVGGRAKG